MFLSRRDSGCSGHFRKYLLLEALPAIVVQAKPAGLAPGQAAPSRPRVCPGHWGPEGERQGSAWGMQTRKESRAGAVPFLRPLVPGAACLYV